MHAVKEHLVSYTEAADELGTTRQVIAEVVRRLAITPKSIRMNGRAKGLDRLDMRRIRRLIGPAPETVDSPASDSE